MSNELDRATLNRAELIDRVERAWINLGYEPYDAAGALSLEGERMLSEEAVDVVLRAVRHMIDPAAMEETA